MAELPKNPPKDAAVPTHSSKIPRDKVVPMPSMEKWIGQAMETYEIPLVRFAYTLLYDMDLARQIVRGIFARLCEQNIARVQNTLKLWLYMNCRNAALDSIRERTRNKPLEEIRWKKVAGVDLQAEELTETQEQLAQLSFYLQHLSDDQRHVILLKFQQNLTDQEIKEITGIRETSVRLLVATGLKNIRSLLPTEPLN